MRIPNLLLDSVDMHAVVRDELLAQNRFLPPDLVNYALIANAGEVAGWLETKLRREVMPLVPDIVLARKGPRGSRPLPYMSLEDRLVYRAVLLPLAGQIPNSRIEGTYEEFQKAPLDEPGCEFVVKTDVAAFYQYIDHERLIDEVIAQTGDDLAVTAAIQLLQESTGRKFGLPQMSDPSDILADCYIDPVRRELLRNAYSSVRYVDDFRVACSSYEVALEALELIERATFQLGLVLNDSKTSTPHRQTYEDSLGAVDRAERDLFSEFEGTVEGFFLVAGEYEARENQTLQLLPWVPGVEVDEVASPPADPTEVEPHQVGAARLLLDLWDQEEPAIGEDWSRATWSVLLRKAFAVLTVDAENADLHPITRDLATELLLHEPHLTPNLVNYLVAVGQVDTDVVVALLDEVTGKHIMSPWQQLWLAHLAGTLPRTVSTRSGHHQWLVNQAENGRHDAVAARATLALAQRQQLTLKAAQATYERVSPVHRRTVALARAAAHGPDSRHTHDDLVDDAAANWVHNQQWGRPRPRRRITRR